MDTMIPLVFLVRSKNLPCPEQASHPCRRTAVLASTSGSNHRAAIVQAALESWNAAVAMRSLEDQAGVPQLMQPLLLAKLRALL